MKRPILSAIVICWMTPVVMGNPQVRQQDLSMIVVRTQSEAADLRIKIQSGASFGALAVQHSTAPSAASGGYIGTVRVEDLRAEFQSALGSLRPGEISAVIPAGKEFVLLRVATPDEQNWRTQNDAGSRALQEQRYQEAAPLLQAAIRTAEQLGREDYHLAESLSALAQVYRLTEKQAEAEPLLRKSLAILEKTLGMEHPRLVPALNGLAETCGVQGNYTEAESLFQRSLAIMEKNQGPDHPSLTPVLSNLALTYSLHGNHEKAESLLSRSLKILETVAGPDEQRFLNTLSHLAEVDEKLGRYADAESIQWRILSTRWGGGPDPERVRLTKAALEAFAAVLDLGYFADEKLTVALKEYERALAAAQPGEELYSAMRDELVGVKLVSEAEKLMLRAVQEFPNSISVRYGLAEFYVKADRYEQALKVFEETSRMRRNPDPAVDRLQRSSIHQRIGDMNAFLVRFDEALTAYTVSLDLNPANAEAGVALGNLFLRRDLPENALTAFGKVIANQPRNAAGYLGLAEANLRLGKFPESATAANKALEIEPELLSSRYTLAKALLQAGQSEQGQRELDTFQKADAEKRAGAQRQMNRAASIWGAMAKVKEGNPGAAIGQLQKEIADHPDAADLYVGLALIQSKVGMHQEAVETFKRMLDLKLGDSFVVHRSLALEYGLLGDAKSSQRHRAIYLREYVTALDARSN